MTSFNPTAPGTDGSVPAATPAGSDPNTVAVLQTMLNAMATLTHQPQASGAPAPVPVVSAIPAPAVVTPAPPPVVVSPTPTGFRIRGLWVVGALYVVVPPQHLAPIAESTPANDEDEAPAWYCITRGKYIGITCNNFLALTAVIGVSGGCMKSYKTQVEALEMFNELLDYNMVSVVACSGESDDAEILQLLASLDMREVEPALPPPRTPAPRPTPPPSQTASRQPPPYVAATHTVPAIPPLTYVAPTIYAYDSPTRCGRTTDWAIAGSATQGVPHSSVRAVQKTPKKKTTKGAYIVFYGLRCGVFLKWSEVVPLVKGISCSIYRGYRSFAEAEAAFTYARARGWTRNFDAPLTPIPRLPRPLALDGTDPVNPLHGAEHLDDRWFIVYSGISPGVYRSHLECQLNTVGIRGALHESVEGKRAALDKYARAVEQGTVRVIQPTYSDDVATDPFY